MTKLVQVEKCEELLKPVDDVVTVLENVLSLARSGRLRSVGFSGVLTNGEVCCGFAGRYFPALLIGELEVLKRDIMDSFIDLKHKPAGEDCE